MQASIYFFRQVARVYQNLNNPDRQVLEHFVSSYFPLIEGIVEKIMQNYNNDTAKLLWELLQMFHSAIHMDIPVYLKDFSRIGKWLLFIKAILGAPLEAKEYTFCWKVREEAAWIVLKLLQQYCDHYLDGKKDQNWNALFGQQFGADLLASCESLFALVKVSYMTEELISLLLKVFYYALKNERIRSNLLPRCDNLLFEFLLPAIDVKATDFKLLEQDPIEYIRMEEDLLANVVKRAAVDVIDMLSNLTVNGKSFIIRFVEYAATSLLDTAVPAERKVTIIYLIGYLNIKILANDFLRQQISQFVVRYLLPFLKVTNSVLLSTTCEVLSIYLSKVSVDPSALESLVSELYNCLNNKLLVIRYKAILAFTAMLEHDEAVLIVKPHFNNILTIYVRILDELDHERLLRSLQSMVGKFKQEISQMGDKLIQHMIRMFMKYSVAKEQQEAEDEEQDDAENAAIASLSTIREILNTGLGGAMCFEVSGSLIQLFIYILENDLQYVTEIIDVLVSLLYHADRLSDYVFLYLTFRAMLEGKLLPTSLQCPRMDIVVKIQQSFEEVDEILSVLKNLIRIMPPEVLHGYPMPTNPGLLLCLIENKLIQPEQLANLNLVEVDAATWSPTLQSYLALVYGIGELAATQNAIRHVPNGVSLYPWICGVNDPRLFAEIIEKVMGRLDVS